MLRRFSVGMPQLGVNGLAEGWLWRELGDLHWTTLCRARHTPSRAIADSAGVRLYASFVRIRLEAGAPLAAVGENDRMQVRTDTRRWGEEVYLSEGRLRRAGAPFSAGVTLLSIFSRRDEAAQTPNDRLVRAIPAQPDDATPELDAMPRFGVEARRVRHGKATHAELAGFRLPLDTTVLAEARYRPNAWHDFNGAGLLYFASYPVMDDICLANAAPRAFGVSAVEWATRTSVLARDVVYLANADLDATLVHHLHHVAVDGDRVAYTTTLARERDARPIARLTTVRAVST